MFLLRNAQNKDRFPVFTSEWDSTFRCNAFFESDSDLHSVVKVNSVENGIKQRLYYGKTERNILYNQLESTFLPENTQTTPTFGFYRRKDNVVPES